MTRYLRRCLPLVALLLALGPGASAAKGGPQDVIIGGGPLGPSYYTIQEAPPPPDRFPPWNGGDERRAVPPPPGAGALLASSYEVYYDYAVPGGGPPPARFVPAGPGRPAYLYWQGSRNLAPPGSWFELPDEAARYFQRAVDQATADRAGGGGMLSPDPIGAWVRHGHALNGASTGRDTIREGYVVRPLGPQDGPAPAEVARLRGTDAEALLAAYIETLHRFEPMPQMGPPSPASYVVTTVEGVALFTYEPREGFRPARVRHPSGYGGYFEPAPALTAIMNRATRTGAGARSTAGPAPREAGGSDDGWSVLWLAGAVALPGVATVAVTSRRRRRKAAGGSGWFALRMAGAALLLGRRRRRAV